MLKNYPKYGINHRHVYNGNVIEANLKACKASLEEAYNIAFGKRDYLIDVYYSLCKALDKKFEPIFGSERRGNIMHTNADIINAKQMLGYESDWSFKKGIEEFLEWYKKKSLEVDLSL